jgi:hypothetical protein
MACPGFNLPAVEACPAYLACMAADRGTGNAICRRCYAQRSRYTWASVKNALRRRWDWWIATPPLKRAEELAKAVKAEGYPRYFRCYDSGDLCLNAEDTWLKFADLLPETRVWIPTRTWCLPERLDHLRRLSAHPGIIVRPSALCFGDRAPDLPGLSAGSSAPVEGQHPLMVADYVCPGGCGDCRVCWESPRTPVAYKRN